jgi:hypothetical protein
MYTYIALYSQNRDFSFLIYGRKDVREDHALLYCPHPQLALFLSISLVILELGLGR